MPTLNSTGNSTNAHRPEKASSGRVPLPAGTGRRSASSGSGASRAARSVRSMPTIAGSMVSTAMRVAIGVPPQIRTATEAASTAAPAPLRAMVSVMAGDRADQKRASTGRRRGPWPSVQERARSCSSRSNLDPAVEVGGALPGDGDAIAAVPAPDLAATRRNLAGEQLALAEALRPIGDQRGVGRARHRVLGDVVLGREEARDEIAIL